MKSTNKGKDPKHTDLHPCAHTHVTLFNQVNTWQLTHALRCRMCQQEKKTNIWTLRVYLLTVKENYNLLLFSYWSIFNFFWGSYVPLSIAVNWDLHFIVSIFNQSIIWLFNLDLTQMYCKDIYDVPFPRFHFFILSHWHSTINLVKYFTTAQLFSLSRLYINPKGKYQEFRSRPKLTTWQFINRILSCLVALTYLNKWIKTTRWTGWTLMENCTLVQFWVVTCLVKTVTKKTTWRHHKYVNREAPLFHLLGVITVTLKYVLAINFFILIINLIYFTSAEA